MAIYSCNMSSVGRSTHAPGVAGASCRYVLRASACSLAEANGMPASAAEAQAWMNREEAASRANARVADRIMVAIPRELSREQRANLVRDFVSTMTDDRVPWLFAIHQDGSDAHNPHAHIIVRDAEIGTGKRILRFSDSARDRAKLGLEPKPVEFVRRLWEERANAALDRAGFDVRIDRRTLAAQGIDREPQIHIGPEAARIERFVERPKSEKRITGNGREIDYPSIDKGRTRLDRNEEIIDGNLARQSNAPHLETRVWAQFERGQRQLDRRLEQALIAQARQRTAEERRLKADFRTELKALRDQHQGRYRAAVSSQRADLAPRVRALRTRQGDERLALRSEQSGFWARVFRAVDITGGTRRRHQAARRGLVQTQKAERGALAAETRAQWAALKNALADRFAGEKVELLQQRRHALAALREMHRRAERMADDKRQLRATHRERDRLFTADRIVEMKGSEGGARVPFRAPTWSQKSRDDFGQVATQPGQTNSLQHNISSKRSGPARDR